MSQQKTNPFDGILDPGETKEVGSIIVQLSQDQSQLTIIHSISENADYIIIDNINYDLKQIGLKTVDELKNLYAHVEFKKGFISDRILCKPLYSIIFSILTEE